MTNHLLTILVHVYRVQNSETYRDYATCTFCKMKSTKFGWVFAHVEALVENEEIPKYTGACIMNVYSHEYNIIYKQ